MFPPVPMGTKSMPHLNIVRFEQSKKQDSDVVSLDSLFDDLEYITPELMFVLKFIL
jgi:hypothetical protein